MAKPARWVSRYLVTIDEAHSSCQCQCLSYRSQLLDLRLLACVSSSETKKWYAEHCCAVECPLMPFTSGRMTSCNLCSVLTMAMYTMIIVHIYRIHDGWICFQAKCFTLHPDTMLSCCGFWHSVSVHECIKIDIFSVHKDTKHHEAEIGIFSICSCCAYWYAMVGNISARQSTRQVWLFESEIIFSFLFSSDWQGSLSCHSPFALSILV